MICFVVHLHARRSALFRRCRITLYNIIDLLYSFIDLLYFNCLICKRIRNIGYLSGNNLRVLCNYLQLLCSLLGK
mgnify:CR=1 FL=1